MAIPTRIDIPITGLPVSSSVYARGGINYEVETAAGAIYLFHINASFDPVFKKSVDRGITWTTSSALKACTCVQLTVWYQRWTDPSGVLGDKIWCCYTNDDTGDIHIRSIDTANGDALGTEYTVFNGASSASAGVLSICQMRGGNLLCVGMIDAGIELVCRKSTDSGANWSDAAAVMEAAADQIIMMPGWDADTQDGMAFYYDSSATEISVKYYDDSANSWSEAALGTATLPAVSSTLGHWSAAVDHANSQNLCAFWTAVDTANADLRVFKCTQSAQTETASNCVLNSVDDQGFAGISIFGSTWYVIYAGLSSGAQTYLSALSINYKTSTDGGANWSSETNLSPVVRRIEYLFVNPIAYKSIGCFNFNSASTDNIFFNTVIAIPRATFQLGM